MRIRSLTRRFLRQSPRCYMTSYVCIILTFALLYSFWSRSFYHPYVKYEPSVRQESMGIRELLKSALKNRLQQAKDLGLGVTVTLEPYSVAELSERDNQLEAQVLMIVTRRPADGVASVHFLNIPVIFSPSGLGNYVDEATHQPALVYVKVNPVKRVEETNFFPNPSETSKAVVERVSENLEQTRFSAEQLERMEAYIEAASGFPHSVSGTFFRMLYLSVITVTTVGYGDIVPLTGWARFLVGLEATMGIVMLGLFINSLTRTY